MSSGVSDDYSWEGASAACSGLAIACAICAALCTRGFSGDTSMKAFSGFAFSFFVILGLIAAVAVFYEAKRCGDGSDADRLPSIG